MGQSGKRDICSYGADFCTALRDSQCTLILGSFLRMEVYGERGLRPALREGCEAPDGYGNGRVVNALLMNAWVLKKSIIDSN